MSRLTRTDISMAIDMLYHPSSCDESDIRKAVADAITGLKELQHYKDLEEQGKLIELPCKVGDTVYMITDVFDGKETVPMIARRKIDGFDGNNLNPVWMVSKEPYQMNFVPSAFGTRVFLTKEEAEARLEELKGV